MTFFAGNFGMLALEREGCKVMIYLRRLPTFERMTDRAIRSKKSLVIIISLVAGITILGRGPQVCYGRTRVFMTVGARRLNVFSRQRKREQVVVKFCAV
ncbi:MAG: hypothetical protein AUJ21_11325 [Anaerolineae bacterium CG1_02_58_13]|nr:MAG: hypothetical protein AUJ21_11325 [Anaerolineae bacterium CG1_02_58_13]